MLNSLTTCLHFFLGAWWEVDLLEDVAVSRVLVTNRVDCCKDRLSNAAVSLIDNKGKTVAIRLIGNSNDIATFNFVFPVPANLQYTSPNSLTVAGKTWLAKRFMDSSLLKKNIVYINDCGTNCGSSYLTQLAELQTRQASFFDKGLSIESIDKSIALVFGNKTTIGQVCAFSKGLTSSPKAVTDIPGFCCLDAPYQAKTEEWGEKVRLILDKRCGLYYN